MNPTFINPAAEAVDDEGDDIEDGIIYTFTTAEEEDPCEPPTAARVPHQVAIDALELSSSIICSPTEVQASWKSCYSGKDVGLRDMCIVRRPNKPNGGSLSTYITPNTHSLSHSSVLLYM